VHPSSLERDGSVEVDLGNERAPAAGAKIKDSEGMEAANAASLGFLAASLGQADGAIALWAVNPLCQPAATHRGSPSCRDDGDGHDDGRDDGRNDGDDNRGRALFDPSPSAAAHAAARAARVQASGLAPDFGPLPLWRATSVTAKAATATTKPPLGPLGNMPEGPSEGLAGNPNSGSEILWSGFLKVRWFVALPWSQRLLFVLHT
jgi:hypothetical protein